MGSELFNQSGATVEDFFDNVSELYDQSIEKAIPPYREMFQAILGYCFLDAAKPLSILELGCGTGNLSLYIQELFPQAELTLVDLSADMLEVASQKLKGDRSRITLLNQGFMALGFPPQSFDLIVSSMALHHLTDQEKPALYTRLFQWLKPNGLFRCGDETLAVPTQAQERNLTQWESWSRQSGATNEDITMWSEHAEKYDHYAPLASHFEWLKQAGFTDVDCYWRKLMWTVFGARKAA